MDYVGQPPLAAKLRETLSSDRFATYLKAAGFDEDRALRLYLWNAQVGEAFHLPIQAVEVGLRNSVNKGLCAQFGAEWWREQAFRKLLEREQVADIDMAAKRISRRKKPQETPQMVATLSFGFWVGVLQPRFNPPLWTRQLSVSFPNLPDGVTRGSIADSAKRTSTLRNRIWHHEPVFRMSLLDEHSAVMEILTWICPATAQWIRPHCRVPQLLRQKP